MIVRMIVLVTIITGEDVELAAAERARLEVRPAPLSALCQAAIMIVITDGLCIQCAIRDCWRKTKVVLVKVAS